MAGKNVGVFVDVTHQFVAVQGRYGKKINYQKYLEKATNGDELYCAYAFGAQISNEAAGFIKRLRSFGYETRYKQASAVGGYSELNATDFVVDITVEVCRIQHKLDRVVFGSNDPRLIPLIKFMQERGLKVTIFACEIPSELTKISNLVMEIPEDILEKGRI